MGSSPTPVIQANALTETTCDKPIAYTKIDFLVTDLQVTRKTASKYLEQLVDLNLVTIHKIGKENYYVNDALFQYLYNAPELLKFKNQS